MEIHYPYTEMKLFLYDHYNKNELDGLFFDVFGEGTDVLGKELPREKLAQEIVSYCMRRGDLPKLLDAMKRTREEQYSKVFPQFQNPLTSLGLSLKPAEVEIQQDAVGVNLPRVQKLGGYVIDEPPESWIVDELTLKDVFSGKFGDSYAGLAINARLNPYKLEKREIMFVKSRTQLKIEYDPGVSKLNGRITLQIVPDEIPIACLSIFPIERNSSPPTFLRKPFEHIFLVCLIPSLATSNLNSLTASTTGKTNRFRLTAELDQRVENAIVNGISDQSLTINQTIIGIQGYTRDYLLSLSYASHSTINKSEIDNQRELMQSIVDSFKIIKPARLDEEERALQILGDQQYKEYIQSNSSEVIRSQFLIFISKWKELDWNKAESKKQFAVDVKRLKKAINFFAKGDEELNEMLEELNDVTKMARSKIKEYIDDLVDAVKDDPDA